MFDRQGNPVWIRARSVLFPLLVTETRPWLPEDHDDQDWTVTCWHQACDLGSLSADTPLDVRHIAAALRAAAEMYPQHTKPIK